MNDELADLAAAFRDADRAVALTGAGVSTASGIPTFRGEDGIWGQEFRPRDFQLARFEADPEGFWRDRLALHEAMYPPELAPNAAHRALADLEDAGFLEAVITQNTDGLHGAAGSRRVLELHGTNTRVVCRSCGDRFDAEPARQRAREGELPPRCAACDGALKPDVVLFGEDLPPDVYENARELVAGADLLLAAGSSLVVEPAASLPAEAARSGTLVIVNRDETPHDSLARVALRADVTEALPALVGLLRD